MRGGGGRKKEKERKKKKKSRKTGMKMQVLDIQTNQQYVKNKQKKRKEEKERKKEHLQSNPRVWFRSLEKKALPRKADELALAIKNNNCPFLSGQDPDVRAAAGAGS